MSAKESQSKIAQYQEMNRELEETAKRQRLKIDRLMEENKSLQAQVIREKRLRYATKNLVAGTDKAILAQIERLRGGQNSGSVVRYNDADYDTSSAENLLSTIR